MDRNHIINIEVLSNASTAHKVSWCCSLTSSRIASIDTKQLVKIWDSSTGKQIQETQVPKGWEEISRSMISQIAEDTLVMYNLDTLDLWKITISTGQCDQGKRFQKDGKQLGFYPLGSSVLIPIRVTSASGTDLDHIFTLSSKDQYFPSYHGELKGSLLRESHVLTMGDGKVAIADSSGCVSIIDAKQETTKVAQITEGKIAGIARFDDHSILVTGLEWQGYSVQVWNYNTNDKKLLSDWKAMGSPAHVDGISRLNDVAYVIWDTGLALIDVSGEHSPVGLNQLLKAEFDHGLEGRIRQIVVEDGKIALGTDIGAICFFDSSSRELSYSQLDSPINHLGIFKDGIVYLDEDGKIFRSAHAFSNPTHIADGMRHFVKTDDEHLLAWGDRNLILG